ncbi:MAG: S8 family serine peptidase [Rhodothermaceae bacterium]|nr:S8 family serine peptidase [Rhodothermaceae bacterium]
MLGALFSTPLLLAIIGSLLIAWDISKKDKKPAVVITGLVFLGLMVLVRLKIAITQGTFLGLFTGVASNMGVALLVSAGYLAVKKSKAKPFFVLGVLALGLSLALTIVGKVLGISEASQSQTLFEGTEELNNHIHDASILVELGPDDSIMEIYPIYEKYHIHVSKAFPELTLQMDADLAQVYMFSGDADELERLMEELRLDTENVDHASINIPVSLDPPASTPSAKWKHKRPIVANDPLSNTQWTLEAIDAPAVHEILKETSPVRKARVAILDTGVESKHEDITPVFVKTPGNTDEHGHGTHCAGIAGAATNNDLGMASLNWNGDYIDILSYQALGSDGMGSLETIAQAIIDAARNDADVISMSLGGFSFTPPKVIKDAVEFAMDRGAIVVAASGNSNQDAKNHMPSNVEGVISVSAVDQNGNKAKFSNTNTSLTRPIAAPGVDVVSLIPGNDYGPKSGTSMATPVVSGLLGIMRSLYPELTASQAYTILHESGVTLDDSNKVGRMIDADAAVNAVLELRQAM